MLEPEKLWLPHDVDSSRMVSPSSVTKPGIELCELPDREVGREAMFPGERSIHHGGVRYIASSAYLRKGRAKYSRRSCVTMAGTGSDMSKPMWLRLQVLHWMRRGSAGSQQSVPMAQSDVSGLAVAVDMA